MVAFARSRILAGSFRSSLGTAAWRRILYFVSDLVPVDPWPASALLDQRQILRIFQPLGDRFLNDRLCFETVLLAIAIQRLLQLFVDAMGDRSPLFVH